MSTRVRTSRISVSATERRFFVSRWSVSRSETDGTRRPTDAGASGLRARWSFERLLVGDLDGSVEAAHLAALPLRPEARDLDTDRSLHIAGPDRRGDGVFPAARR